MVNPRRKEADLSLNYTKRDCINEQLARFKIFFENVDENKIRQLPDRVKKCGELWDSFQEIQLKIDSILQDDVELSIEKNVRAKFEEEYFDVISLGKSLLETHISQPPQLNYVPQVGCVPQNVTQTVQSVQAKLPLIEIPKFSGSYEQWVTFYDTFNSLIHSNKSLSNIQKFHYLNSSLTDDAALVIQSLQITDQNYSVAWQLLRDRFENKRLITDTYLRELFDISPLTKESHSQLRQFLDKIKRILRTLEVLNHQVSSWDTILIFLLSNKLDINTRREWEAFVQADHSQATLSNFCDILMKRCTLLETLDQNKTTKVPVTSQKVNYKPGNQRQTYITTKQIYSCPFCKETHLPFYCNKFLSLSIRTRIAEAKKLNLCLNCLKSNHSTQDCYSSNCRKCNKKHNTLLHIDFENINQNSSSYTQRNQNNSNQTQNTSQRQHNLFSQTSQNDNSYGKTQSRILQNTKSSELTHKSSTFTRVFHSNSIKQDSDKGESNSYQLNTNCTPNQSIKHSQENLSLNNYQTDTYENQTSNQSKQLAHVLSGQQTVSAQCVNTDKSPEVLLSTALVYIKNKFGTLVECRALLDSGSQSNFITQELCTRLKLNKNKINIPVIGISQAVTNISDITETSISSRINSYSANTTFLVVKNITENLPSTKIDTKCLHIPEELLLADPTYHTPNKVDILVGATLFWELLSVGQIKLNKGGPLLQKTKLGWLLVGAVPYQCSSQPRQCHLSINEVHKQMEKFWKLEEVEDRKSILSKEERICEDIFQNTTTREGDGRFCVNLPIKEELPRLEDTFITANSRFQALERKFTKNENYKQSYVEFMTDYENLGHMTKIKTENIKENQEQYYIPHHGILKESITTRLRVVFDASAQGQGGLSLNDKLLVGPKIQDDLFDILLRFRVHKYAMVADIEKMYRQINVTPEQRPLQRIIWRNNTDEQIQVYELNTVTYGTASAPFLAVRCLIQVGLDTQLSHPQCSKVILNDFYMDDVLTGANTIEEAKKLKADLTNVLKDYGFNLRKWLSNCPEVLVDLHNNESTYFIQEDKTTKTLGLTWNSEEDTFQYSVKPVQIINSTKRGILSAISQVFDPMGLIGPTIIKAKILLQKLFKLKINWDESLPMDIHTSWIQIYQQFPALNDLKIPRLVFDANHVTKLELHCFCDASEQAYGCCIYVRTITKSNETSIQLLCAKSRVAPIQQISLPRLELCGAVLVSQLASRVLNSLKCTFDSIVFWTDSTIVLSWLAAEPSQWKTFVGNRVAEVQRLTSEYLWKHIRSEDNPADVISRGLNPEQLKNCDLWWYGPIWLQDSDYSWPRLILENIEVPEKRKIFPCIQSHHCINQESLFTNLFSKFSTLLKLQRVLSYILRFISNCKIRSPYKNKDCLTVQELNYSLLLLLKMSQKGEFSDEIKALKKCKYVSKSSKLLSLNPVLDNDGLLRVGGRLENSNLSLDQKHPIILPKNHALTNLIILHYHYLYLHSGPQALLAIIRLKYWPISGRNTIRKILSKCIVCFKNKPRHMTEIMSELPTDRITPCRPFSVCGTDFAGPFKIKTSNLRNPKILKAYMCIFVCFVTKAVHIEIVSDLSTDAFLNCFKRFIARRGLCSKIYSDNGTNYVGANKELQIAYDFLNNQNTKTYITDYLSRLNISWKFIPPRSPHFGGLWESAVKSAKYHIKRVVGETILTFEELYTVFTQVESCLNSRPLIPLSEDPSLIQALTPAHFLIGSSLAATPQEEIMDGTNRLTRYRLLTQLIQQFWKKWSTEYLSSLQPRKKWKTSSIETIQPGTMVLVREEGLAPNQWCLGRVTETFTGTDGKVRVVNVRTHTGVFKRTITKLSVLPISD